jgi:hypothetical protein
MPNQWTKFSLEDRFNAQWELRGECWEWTGPLSGHGYGRIKDNYVTRSAHRVSYELAYGTIPQGASICHTCDNPKCVRPLHLYAGSHSDNMRDRRERGRANMPYGESHYNAKLSDDQVIAIRNSTDKGVDLARRFGVHTTTISQIRNGQRRKKAVAT